MAVRKLQPIGARKTASPAPESQLNKEPEKDLVRSFMRENPTGSLPDEPEEVRGADGEVRPDTFDAEQPQLALEAPEKVEPATETPAEPTAGEVPAVQSGEAPPTPQAEVKPEPAKVEKPAAEVKAEPAKPAAIAEPSYDPGEKIHLLAGSEPWTREQVVLGLQERATLQPKAEEADKFRGLLGGDYADAESRWKPVLEKLAANPQRTQLLEELLGTDDPALLDYMRQSAEFYKTQVPADQRPAQPAQPSATEKRMLEVANAMEQSLFDQRSEYEWNTIYSEFPFVRNDLKARQALAAAADRLVKEDAAKGIGVMQRRGILDALKEQRVFLEMAKIAHDNRPQVSADVQPQSPPASGAQALLPSNGPGASGAARRSAPAREEYHGNPKDPYGGDPVKAFLAKHQE